MVGGQFHVPCTSAAWEQKKKKKATIEGYKYFYNSSEDSFIYSKEEEREIYNHVDSILTDKYNLLVANNAFDDKHIYLVDLGKED